MYKRTGAPVSHAEVAEAVEATIERWVREAPAVLDAIAASDRHRLLVEKPDWATARKMLAKRNFFEMVSCDVSRPWLLLFYRVHRLTDMLVVARCET